MRVEPHFSVRPSEPLGLTSSISSSLLPWGQAHVGRQPGRGVLTPSTPFGVSAGRFTSFHAVSRREFQRFRRSADFRLGSIPGSSTIN